MIIGPAGYDPAWDDIRDPVLYFDRAGRPASLRKFAECFENKRVDADSIVTAGGKRVLISTVWLGVDHSFWRDGPPIIFETMAFGQADEGSFSPHDLDCARYATEKQAFEGHREMVGRYAQDWWLDLGGRA